MSRVSAKEQRRREAISEALRHHHMAARMREAGIPAHPKVLAAVLQAFLDRLERPRASR